LLQLPKFNVLLIYFRREALKIELNLPTKRPVSCFGSRS